MPVTRTLARLNEQYLQSLLNSDPAWFDSHLADEFLCIEADGTVRTKPEFVRKVAGGAGLRSYHLDDIRIRVIGDVGVVQALGAYLRLSGESGSSRYTDIYARLDGEWKVISAQVTGVEPRQA